jgi:hypothetical protein
MFDTIKDPGCVCANDRYSIGTCSQAVALFRNGWVGCERKIDFAVIPLPSFKVTRVPAFAVSTFERKPAILFTSGLLGVMIVMSAGKTNLPVPATIDAGWGMMEKLFWALVIRQTQAVRQASNFFFIQQTLAQVTGLYK